MEVAVDLGRALEAQGIPYAIGGALAFGMWGRPRFTADIDVNVFIQVDELDSLVGAFEDAGVSWEPAEARRRASAEGMFVAWAGSFRVDVFTPSQYFDDDKGRDGIYHGAPPESAPTTDKDRKAA